MTRYKVMDEGEYLNGRSISQRNLFYMSYKVIQIVFLTSQFQWCRETIQTKWPRKMLTGVDMLLHM